MSSQHCCKQRCKDKKKEVEGTNLMKKGGWMCDKLSNDESTCNPSRFIALLHDKNSISHPKAREMYEIESLVNTIY